MHYRSLDGLRGLAAYTVIVGHFSNQTKIFGGLLGFGSGQVGVMLFFVLSGFLMARLYMHQPATPASVGDFFRKRVARVIPLYLIIVIGSWLWLKGTGSRWPFYAITDENIAEHLLFWHGTSVLWTIAVEVQFYLLFPLVWLVYRRSGWVLVFWLALAVALIAAAGFPRVPVLLVHVSFFFFGIMVSLLPQPEKGRSLDIIFVVLLVSYAIAMPQIRKMLGIDWGGAWTSPVYMLLIPSLLAVTLFSPLADRLLGNAPARFLGQISYSAYLLHIPILHALTRTPVAHNIYLFLIVFLLTTTAVSYASFRLIEVPTRNWINGRSAPPLLRMATRWRSADSWRSPPLT